jgi:dihydrofolate reductase
MRNLFLFMVVTLDGFFAGPDGALDWHNVDEEFDEFAAKQLDEVDTLLFGRETYQGMAEYWTTPAAKESDPSIANKMNGLPKVVFSRTLEKVEWENSRLVRDHVGEEVADLKRREGRALAILGSSNLATSLLEMGLLDELRIMVNPVVLGEGKHLFAGIHDKLRLRLLNTRSFRSGNVLLQYHVLR